MLNKAQIDRNTNFIRSRETKQAVGFYLSFMNFTLNILVITITNENYYFLKRIIEFILNCKHSLENEKKKI